MHNPTPNDRYRDKRGIPVTVKRCEFNRVIFTREGYPADCVYPLDRFVKEFTYQGENPHE